MKKFLTIASIIALYSSASFAKDQDHMNKMPPKPHNLEKIHEKMFSEVDSNSDGVISKKEWSEFHGKKFNEIDENKDGNVTKEEMKKLHEKMREKWHEMKEKISPDHDKKMNDQKKDKEKNIE